MDVIRDLIRVEAERIKDSIEAIPELERLLKEKYARDKASLVAKKVSLKKQLTVINKTLKGSK